MYIEQTNSTNDLIRTLDVDEVWTTYQSSGRGQKGNVWESERGKNILMSYRLRGPVPASDAFVITMASSLAVLATINEVLGSPARTSVKWPNDIYVGDKKICGILIESRLKGTDIDEAIIGIGLNVNQTRFSFLTPTSLALELGKEFVLEPLHDRLVEHLHTYLRRPSRAIKELYMSHLYRREGYHPYREVSTGRVFDARIAGIGDSGELLLEERTGECHGYLLKQVVFEGR